MKKILYVILTLSLILGCVLAFAGCDENAKYGSELLSNGSFENGASYWYESKAVTNTSDGVLNNIGFGGDSTEYYLTVTNGSTHGNYIKLYQEVAVKRNAVYKLTARINNQTIKQGSASEGLAGAGIQIVEDGTILAQYEDVTDGWTDVTVYVKPKNTNTLTVALIFGNTANPTSGTVAFDDVSMVRIKNSEIPAGERAVSIFKVREPAYEYASDGATALVVCLAILAVLVIVGLYYSYRHQLSAFDKPLIKKSWLTALILAAGAMLIRFLLAGLLFDKGGAASMRAILWNIADKGVGSAGLTYTQYSPLEIYYLWVIGKITRNWSDLSSMTVMLQLLPILCEGITVAMVYLFAKKYVTDKQAALFGALYAVLPVAFLVSGGYSFEIPVLTMLLFITFYALIEKDLFTLLAASLITVLWSSIGIYVLPFIVAYELYLMFKTKDKKTIITICVGWFLSFWLFILLSAGAVSAMFKAGHIMYIFKNYYLMMFNRQICVSNAFNLYALFGLNGGSVNNAAFWLNIVFSVILIIYCVSLYFKNYNRAEMTLIAAFFLTVMAVFSLNMNETALTFGLIMLLMYIVITGEIRLFWVFGMLSFMAFMNVGIVMDYTGVLGETYKLVYFNKGDAGYAIANVICACTVLYYGWVVYDITTNGKLKYIQPMKAKTNDLSKVPGKN